MKRLLITVCLLPALAVGQTLDECQQAAQANYPLIRQYDLIRQTTDLTVSNLAKGWLPQLSAQAQATWQSDVVTLPDGLSTMMSQMGTDVKGLKKAQYRVGIDVSQTLYDGGAIRQQKAVARQQGEVEAGQNDVTLYAVRQRVNELYFGLLLVEDRIRLNNDLQAVLSSSEQKLASLYKRGVAAESDYLSVKAERLGATQQATELEAQRRTLQRMLSTFCGIEVVQAVKPVPYVAVVQQQTKRPELNLIDAQLKLTDAQERLLGTALMPRLSIFAQGFYGYPGYDMYHDMLHHDFTLNGLVGARLTWNIGSLYTRKNDKAKLNAQRAALGVQRETFLFNNQLEQIQQNENISRYQQLMADDEQLIQLRASVRRAAESKLAHGIIDVNDLVKEINNENTARTQQSIHEIEMLREMYNLKYTTNP